MKRNQSKEQELVPEEIKPMEEYSNDDIIGLHAQAIAQFTLFGTRVWFDREHIFCAELQKRMRK